MTSRSVEQDATVTFASALRRRSIGAVASISSNPLASRVRTVGAIIRKNMGKLILAFLELEDFLVSFLVVEEEDESEEELELLSDDLEESDESEDLDESESPIFFYRLHQFL